MDYKIVQIMSAPSNLVAKYINFEDNSEFEEKIVAIALIEWNDNKEREVWYMDHNEEGNLRIVESGQNYNLKECYFKE
ncbi:hypothetical protein SAMN02745163_03734 [Clostridium cavendishii DSM 21758]|uniref:Phage protein n=1 Tax=Clostridium cavendishii DSM 21758 TaxID=1121302 RepID=A0A1M6S2G7_9CLOT|nr:hypothetical protein [Clostridium cavendishii]SHK38890.1 hypothetical protein SAMN02745163_03734 [Clostridium cavendishii DSM 21758]